MAVSFTDDQYLPLGKLAKMQFTTEDVIRFARWDPVVTGYDRDESTIAKHIQPILNRIGVSEDVLGSALEKVAYRVFEDGGLTNYFAFFVFHPQDLGSERGTYRFQPGITVYLSLLAPVGVLGYAERMLGQGVCGPPYLEIDNLISPRDPGNAIATLTATTISTTDYRLLSPDEANQPLPAGVQPYEYCMCREPWDRVFHVLFANSD